MKKTIAVVLQSLSQEKNSCNPELTIPKQSEQMGIPYQTFNKYIKGTAECSASNLVKMAQYYQVSVDYILGQTKSKTFDTNLRSICDMLNLSDKAVQQLITPWIYQNASYVMEYEGQYEIIVDIIDKLISRNILFEAAKEIEEAQTLFEQFIANLKQISITYDNSWTSVKKASSLMAGWKHTDDGLNYSLSMHLPDFRKEKFQSLYQIFTELNMKISKIWTANSEIEQRRSIDDYNAYLSSL